MTLEGENTVGETLKNEIYFIYLFVFFCATLMHTYL